MLHKKSTLSAVVLWFLASLPVLAQAEEPTRLGFEDYLKCQAVGRVDSGGGFCTGVLIAEQLVLTAAHCLAGAAARPRQVRAITFRAGQRDGLNVAQRQVARAVVHPEFSFDDDAASRDVGTNLALLELDRLIPSELVAPFRIAALGPDSRDLDVFAYSGEGVDALMHQAGCNVVGSDGQEFALACDAAIPAEGSPTFDYVLGVPRLVSLLSPDQPVADGHAALGVELSVSLEYLKRVLRSGKGVIAPPEIRTRDIRVRPSGGAPNAKFLRS